jgi:hypothetical protein
VKVISHGSIADILIVRRERLRSITALQRIAPSHPSPHRIFPHRTFPSHLSGAGNLNSGQFHHHKCIASRTYHLNVFQYAGAVARSNTRKADDAHSVASSCSIVHPQADDGAPL